MNTVKNLRKQQYDYHREIFPYLFDFIRNPYTFLKARLYMEASAILVWLLLKTNIKPNTVTVIYGLAGIATGILLSIPNDYTILIALGIAFTKGILDWSDGHLARITGQTSLTGHILDSYGAHLNSLGFQIGLGLYIAARTDLIFFYYLVPALLLFRTSILFIYTKYTLFKEIADINIISNYKKKNWDSARNKIQRGSLESLHKNRYAHYLNVFLDDRARFVDFICLIILLEMVFPINVSWIIFLLIVVKYFIIFSGSFYIVAKGGYAENEAMNKIRDLHILLGEDNT